MELFVNGNRIDFDHQPTPGNINEMVDLLSDQYVPLNEVITEVSVNGQRLNTDEEQSLMHCAVEDVDRLEVRTANPIQLVREGLEESLGYMERLIKGLEKIVLLYREGNMEEAGRLFLMAIEGIQWFASLISLGERYSRINYHKDTIDGKHVAQHFRELGRLATESSKLQERMNWADMAEFLEQEFIPHFAAWKTMIPELIDTVSEGSRVAEA